MQRKLKTIGMFFSWWNKNTMILCISDRTSSRIRRRRNILTSMDKDGTKSSFDVDLLQKVSNFLNIPLIASGGVGKLAFL